MIALDKPAGQLVHPSPRKNEGTLANALLGYYERTDQPCGIHPVTRLDRDTSAWSFWQKTRTSTQSSAS